MQRKLLIAVVGAAALIGGCKDENNQNAGGPAPTASSGQASSGQASSGQASSGQGPSGTAQPAKGGEHPNAVPLGTQTINGLELRATQDEPIKPGGEGAFDLLIKGGKPKAVRFWVGVETGEGSVKAKAEEETPDNWHTHVEVPRTLPPGSKFWAEVEPQTGTPFKVGFDLK